MLSETEICMEPISIGTSISSPQLQYKWYANEYKCGFKLRQNKKKMKQSYLGL